MRELGESFDKPQSVTRCEWYVGMAVLAGNSVARIAGIDPTTKAVA